MCPNLARTFLQESSIHPRKNRRLPSEDDGYAHTPKVLSTNLNRNPESGFRQRESGILFLLGGFRGVLEILGRWRRLRADLVHLLATSRGNALLLGVDVRVESFFHGSARYLRGRFLQWRNSGVPSPLQSHRRGQPWIRLAPLLPTVVRRSQLVLPAVGLVSPARFAVDQAWGDQFGGYENR